MKFLRLFFQIIAKREPVHHGVLFSRRFVVFSRAARRGRSGWHGAAFRAVPGLSHPSFFCGSSARFPQISLHHLLRSAAHGGAGQLRKIHRIHQPSVCQHIALGQLVRKADHRPVLLGVVQKFPPAGGGGGGLQIKDANDITVVQNIVPPQMNIHTVFSPMSFVCIKFTKIQLLCSTTYNIYPCRQTRFSTPPSMRYTSPSVFKKSVSSQLVTKVCFSFMQVSRYCLRPSSSSLSTSSSSSTGCSPVMRAAAAASAIFRLSTTLRCCP